MKAVVVACNTATGIAVDALRARYTLPIVAIEPAVKPAAAQTRSRVVGVLATTQTLAGQKFAKLVSTHAGDVEVLTQACPGLVEQVERGALTSASTRSLVEQYLRPLLDRGRRHDRPGMHALSLRQRSHSRGRRAVRQHHRFGGPVAREVRRRLQVSGLLAPESRIGTETFWTTGSPEQVAAVIEQLWSSKVDVRPMPVASKERSASTR